MGANMLQIIFFGAFGGMAPTLMKLASTYVAHPGPMPAITVLLGLSLYAIIGGGIAIALGEQNMRGALFAGIAAPALITNAITGAQDDGAKGQQAKVSVSLIAPAYAESLGHDRVAYNFTSEVAKLNRLSAPILQANKSVTIFGPSVATSPTTVDVCFLDQENAKAALSPADDGKNVMCSKQVQLTAKSGTSETLQAPPETAAVSVAGKPIVLDKPLNPVGLTVEKRPTFLNDFLWSLGGKRALSAELTPSPLPTAGTPAVQ